MKNYADQGKEGWGVLEHCFLNGNLMPVAAQTEVIQNNFAWEEG